jgi:thioredoxin-like negative regulator of GroEL
MDDEADEVLRKLKEKRMSEFEHMKDENERKKKRDLEGYGEYSEIDEEKFMKFTTSQPFVVCHFYHNDFIRCKIMDKHLRIISRDHPECKFYCLDVQRAPFIVEKLQIRMLPTLGIFIDGILIESIIGYIVFDP